MKFYNETSLPYYLEIGIKIKGRIFTVGYTNQSWFMANIGCCFREDNWFWASASFMLPFFIFINIAAKVDY